MSASPEREPPTVAAVPAGLSAQALFESIREGAAPLRRTADGATVERASRRFTALRGREPAELAGQSTAFLELRRAAGTGTVARPGLRRRGVASRAESAVERESALAVADLEEVVALVDGGPFCARRARGPRPRDARPRLALPQSGDAAGHARRCGHRAPVRERTGIADQPRTPHQGIAAVAGASSGTGLTIMRYRTPTRGGELTIELATDGADTRVACTLLRSDPETTAGRGQSSTHEPRQHGAARTNGTPVESIPEREN